MIYKFERLIYGGAVEPFEIDVPNDIKFVKYYEYGERQQMWMFMMLYDEDKYEELSNKLGCHCHKFGDETDPIWGEHSLFICYMKNVKPLQELPETTMEQFNEEFHKHIEDIYIGHYKFEKTGLINHLDELVDDNGNIQLVDDNGNIQLADTEEKLITTICILHFKNFVKNNCSGNNEPMISGSSVQFTQMFTGEEFNLLEDSFFPFERFFNDLNFSSDYFAEVSIKGFDTSYTRKKWDFNKRVKEITEKL